MGCYMSTPNQDVYVTEGKGKNFHYATASCQGWRREQEDAEVCLPFFDNDSSLFILCDGHGGAEVAKYTVQHLPEFLKKHELYKAGKIEEALEKALIDFDALLRTDEVMEQLHKLAFDGDPNNELNKDSKMLDLKDLPYDQEKDNNGHEEAGGSSSFHNAAGGSSSVAGTSSSSTPNGPSTVVDDVDTDTLRKEAQVPLRQLLEQYSANATAIDPAKRNSLLSKYNSSPVVKARLDDDDDDDDQDEAKDSDNEPRAGSSSSESAGTITKDSIKESLIKQVIQHYFAAGGDDTSDDSEYNGDDSSNDDGDDEGDGEGASTSSKKQRKRKHKLPGAGQDSSSEDDDEDDNDDDDEDDDDDETDDDSEDGEEDEDEEVDGEQADEEADDEEVDHEKDNDENAENIEDEDEDWEDVHNVVRPMARNHKPGLDSGCTVVVALVKDGKLYVASAGDSRCIMIMRNGDCKPMSFDHKPESVTERRRIHAAGGRVVEGRVNGGLNLSRALGDFTYKNPSIDPKHQMITPCPDVRVAELDPEQVEYVFLACDGIWNSMKNQKATKFIRKTSKIVNDNLIEICIHLFRECIAPRTDGDGTGCDNMTCIIARFTPADVIDSTSTEKIENSDLKTNEQTDSEKQQTSDDPTNTQKRSTTNEEMDDTKPKKKLCLRL